MGMRSMLGVVGLGLGLFLALPSAWAADESTAEAAQVPTGVTEPTGATEPTHEQILQAIEATRQTDPELAAEMENQLELFESGELDLRAEGGVPHGTTQEGEITLGVSGGIPNAGEGMPSYMTPELREQLSNVFDRRSGGELTEEQARAQAEAILQEHGIDPREMGPGHEGTFEHEGDWQGDRGEGFERAYMEQMSPEAREQMERFFSDHEAGEQPTMDREAFEREFGTFEAPTHEYEGTVREYEAPAFEYEAPAHEYEAPTHEYEAPTHEYEAPTHEYEAPEGPTAPEYEPPEYDYQPPQQP